MSEKSRLEQLFATLDDWRTLPNYQLERRADIFFSLYLREVIEKHVGPVLSVIIPEMPLKKEENNRSNKVDYVLFGKDGHTVYFVELKTDSNSLRDAQDNYLSKAKQDGFRKICEDLKGIEEATTSKSKYVQLRKKLDLVGESCSNIELIYIVPDKYAIGERPDTYRVIDFQDIIEVIENEADPLSRIFCTYLKKWRVKLPK